jgi:purine-nucleoside phosphorylase
MSTISEVTGSRAFKVAVVLGSGLSDLASSLVSEGPVPFAEIDAMSPARVEGHEGALYWGEIESVPALVFAGRTHLYEGFDAQEVVASIDSSVDSGCEIVLLTNAAGAISPAIDIGAPCLISDHINLTGTNPQRGPHDNRGPRFLDLSTVYDEKLRSIARKVDPKLKEGVYAGLAGPTYETPAEIRMLASFGADLVGMSTVLEAIRARYLGARVLGISVVTNPAAGLSLEPLHHEEVAAAGRAVADRLGRLIRGILAELNSPSALV